MNDIITIIIRTVFFYIFILITFRIMGKREVGQLSIQDLVVNILMAELVAISIENYNDSVWLTVIPIVILIIFEILSAYISLRSNKFRNIIQGKPALIINRGIINYKEMIRQRYSLDDLLSELRNNNIKNLKDVEYAVLENSGKLNIYKYNFLGISSSIPFPLILDGTIQKKTLEYLNKSEMWLTNYLKDNDITKEEIFYAFYKNKKIYMIKRNELRS